MVRAMSTELFLDFLGIRMDSRKAEEMEYTINLVTPDNGEKFTIELSNATLTNIKGYLADSELGAAVIAADLAVETPRALPHQTLAEVIGTPLSPLCPGASRRRWS